MACAPVLGLRRELAAAEAAERLEAQLVAGRAQLATVAVPGSVADPQASALAWLTGVDEGAVRTGIALLLAGLIEVGSALGFTLVSMATARNPQPPSSTPSNTPGSPDAARRRARARRAATPNVRDRRVQTRHKEAAGRRQPETWILRRFVSLGRFEGYAFTAAVPARAGFAGALAYNEAIVFQRGHA